MEDLIFARVVHVLSVVLWIGGVAMVTWILLPTLIRMQSTADAVILFTNFRQRFAAQARITTLLVGLSGFYMVYALNAWGRFAQWQYWWMHAMVLVWLLFSVMLFAIEPRTRRSKAANPVASKVMSNDIFIKIQRKHLMLLILSLMTIAGAVAGSHGWLIASN